MDVDKRKDLRPLESCLTPSCKNDAIRGECYCAECKLKNIATIKRDLAKFYTALENKLLVKVGEYGITYKTSDMMFMERRLRGEIEEHKKSPKDPGELVDIAAICMMLYSNLKN
jgi:hypothetical protein